MPYWNNKWGKLIVGIKPYKNPNTWPIPRYGQYDSGVMSLSIDSGTGGHGFNPIVVAANQTNYGVIKGFFTTSLYYNGKNLPAIQRTPGFVVGGYNPDQWAIIAFRPETPWLAIRKIKVYTNIISSNNSGTQVRLQGMAGYNYYNINYDLDDDPATSNVGEFVTNGAGTINTLMDFQLNNTVAGTATAGTGSIYTSANIGDPGTIWGEKVAFSDNNSNVSLNSDNILLEGTLIGNKTLGTVPYPYSGSWQIPQNTPVEKYYSSYISFQMWPLSYANYGNIPDLKFRFVIEYTNTSDVYE
jgi:hypothetical protein